MLPLNNSHESERCEHDYSLGLILVAVVVLTVFYYHARVDTIAVASTWHGLHAMTGPVVSFGRHSLASLVLVGLVPLLGARVMCGLRPRAVGLGPGVPRRGLAWLAVGIPVAVLLAWLSADHPDARAVYPLNEALRPDAAGFLRHMAGQLAYYTAWELLFRGVLLFGLTPRFGFAGANMIQTALSVVAHFGRPFPETLAALPAGLAFGGVARHTRSIWYVVIIHLVAGAAQDWFIIR